MLTITDLDSVMMDAEATVEEWELEFEQGWARPLTDAAMMQELLSAPGLSAEFRQSDPDEFERLAKQIRRMRDEARTSKFKVQTPNFQVPFAEGVM